MVTTEKLTNSTVVNLTETDSQESFDAIKGAHKLSGKADDLSEYYDDWCRSYDQDVSNEAYCGPEYIAAYFDLLPKQDGSCLHHRNSQMKILDAGCGTGLVGKALRRRGYETVDGFDLSDGMVEKAETTHAYRDLKGGCDMTQQIDYYPDNYYDASLSCGVFTLGHVPPTAIEEMIRFTKPGGLIVVSTRRSYYDSTNFQEVCDRLQTEGKVKLVNSILNGPYIEEEGAYYWAFQVC